MGRRSDMKLHHSRHSRSNKALQLRALQRNLKMPEEQRNGMRQLRVSHTYHTRAL